MKPILFYLLLVASSTLWAQSNGDANNTPNKDASTTRTETPPNLPRVGMAPAVAPGPSANPDLMMDLISRQTDAIKSLAQKLDTMENRIKTLEKKK